ncbi:MAG: class II aldolase/adducin family protein [Gammaproteobacteria bacterium]|nr:class II aldolase/adducin family protein [Gammaproteobacteria bacterium]
MSNSHAVASADTSMHPTATSEATDRKELAMAFRLAERFGFHEGICNHFSVRLPDENNDENNEERYLINPYGVHWSEMTPEKLLLIDGDGQVLKGQGVVEDTARFIHVAGHRANSRHKAILHTHQPWATALTLLDQMEVRMAHQGAARFYERIDYVSEFGGLAVSDEEGERLAKQVKSKQHIDVTFLAHHGVVVGASSISSAFDDLYYLERTCRQQVLAMQTGIPLKDIPLPIIEKTARQIMRDRDSMAAEHFSALCRVLENNPQHVFVF